MGHMAKKTEDFDKLDSPISYVAPSGRSAGLLRGANDGSAWLYAKIPWQGSLTDGASEDTLRATNSSLDMFFNGLASLVKFGGMRWRNLVKESYREFHILAGSIPVAWQVPANMRGSQLGAWQTDGYQGYSQQRAFAVAGVKLYSNGRHYAGNKGSRNSETRFNRILDGWDNAVYEFANGITADDAFIRDQETIEQIMLDAGMQPFTMMMPRERDDLLYRARTWWVSTPGSASLPVLAESQHLHFFPDIDTAMNARQQYDNNIPCKDWHIPGQLPATIFFMKGTDFDHTSVTDPDTMWIGHLLDVGTSGGAGALAVSIRGSVEPSKVTAQQLMRNQDSIFEAEEQRQKAGRRISGDMQSFKNNVTNMLNEYQNMDVPPTLFNTSVAVCVAGDEHDAGDALHRIRKIHFTAPVSEDQQLRAWQSMNLCSPVRVVPYELQTTSTLVSASGISSFAQAGDRDGALLGFTEASKQPVYLRTTVSQDEDVAPLFVIVGATGSGKTMTLLDLGIQWSQIPSRTTPGTTTPVIFINPKQNKDDDFKEAITNVGGTVKSMSSDMADGVFDPLNVLKSREEAKTAAVNMLTQIMHPEGDDPQWELDLTSIIDFGMRNGARCCGQALELAKQEFDNNKDSKLPESTTKVHHDINQLAESSQMFRLVYGTTGNTQPLNVSTGITLINAGTYNLVPDSKVTKTMNGRVQQWVLRMSVLGAGAAVQGRDGVVILDEAWVALGEGSSDIVKQWGRMARSQRFLPVLASQQVGEFLQADLAGYISRGIMLSLPDASDDLIASGSAQSEAKNALDLFKVNDRGGRIRSRMPLRKTLDNGNPNWGSLQALRTPDQYDDNNNLVQRGSVIRGSVGYFVDIGKEPVPVTIDIAPTLLEQISTNALDTDERNREMAQRKAKQMELQRQAALQAV